MGDSWASMVNTPLLPMFQKSSTANNNATGHGQTVDLAAAKLNDLYGGGNVPRLDGPEKFRRSSKGHVHDNSGSSTAVNNGVTNNGVYGDDGDLISGQHAPGVGRVPSASSRGGSGSLRMAAAAVTSNWSGAQSPALSNTSGRFGGSDDGSSAMAAAHQQAALAGLGMSAGSTSG
jgi:hypothetical protein